MESIGTSAESIAHAFVRAINRQDAEQVAALMSPTHRFIDSLGKVIEGREKMREGWAAYFRMVPDYSVAIEEIYPSDPVVILLGVAQGTYSREGNLNPENRWQTPVAIRALVEEGLVAEWRVYADNEPIRKVMATGK
ncbi:nuclear transport factor 2 family protein [Telmatobacter sp. DSM 110680]|uniref:Nuclear transport factor 2 family protein n=1 Tax=Telmatobacter sp. DSM 110680 TaxID=3036704 RepID=A0AAU7DCR2_9BACT